jgi:hypothetical protein
VPNKKKCHFVNDYNSILFVVTKDNNIFEFENHFEHNDFVNKLSIMSKNAMLIFPTISKKIQMKNNT